MSNRLNLFSYFVVGTAALALPSHADEITERGTLQQGDDQLDTEEYYDTYTLDVTQGQVVEVTMTSSDVDAYIVVEPPEGNTYENDDIDFEADNVNASVRFIAEETGTFKILATTSASGESGKYRLTMSASDTELIQTEEGELDAEDDVSWKGGEYYDLYEIKVGPGLHAVVLATVDFDAFVTVHAADGAAMFQGDDPPVVFIDGGKKGAAYTVVVTSYSASETGEYELFVRSVGE